MKEGMEMGRMESEIIGMDKEKRDIAPPMEKERIACKLIGKITRFSPQEIAKL